MASFRIRTAALLVAGIALTPAPSFAQGSGRRHGGEGGRRQGVERAQPRGGGESRGRVESQRRAEPRGRVESHGRAVPRGRVEPYRGYDNRSFDNRSFDNRTYGYRSYGYPSHGYRSYGYRSYGYQSYGYRPYSYRPYSYRSYGYRPHINRSYVLPYGYRPYGYRPGWSLNFYFGRPYAPYGYPAYGYPAAAYGYYAIAPGRAYGAVRIVDAPHNARVFVDGYYAGVVDDYDGVFQHLNLEAGPHHIEIEEEGYPPIALDVRVEPGQTITYRANIR